MQSTGKWNNGVIMSYNWIVWSSTELFCKQMAQEPSTRETITPSFWQTQCAKSVTQVCLVDKMQYISVDFLSPNFQLEESVSEYHRHFGRKSIPVCMLEHGCDDKDFEICNPCSRNSLFYKEVRPEICFFLRGCKKKTKKRVRRKRQDMSEKRKL